MNDGVCPACGENGLEVVFQQAVIPLNSCLLLDNPQEAIGFPTGAMHLAFCRCCGFLSNLAFNPAAAEYSGRYEETQSFSPRFNAFATDLAQRWIDRYEIRGKRVLEIGCGKGEFLVLMCEFGNNRGIGIDPGVHPERITSSALERIEFIADFYDERYSDLDIDVVICRHTLEHIGPVASFMSMLRGAIGARENTIVLFELPDVLRVLREGAFWDVYYEHCSYFSAGSLGRLFRATGFELLDISLAYDGQYLLAEARPSLVAPAQGVPLAIEDDRPEVALGVETFVEARAAAVARWRDRITEVTDRRGRVVLWGSGSKAVAFLAALDLRSEVAHVVDINPFKQGKFLAGSGAEIIAPERLKVLDPDLVIIMNPIYRDEIRELLAGLGLTPALDAV